MIQVACGDDFSLALTLSGKLYTWGLIDDGRLGVRKAFEIQEEGKSTCTHHPQRVQFTEDKIQSIAASEGMAICRVKGTADLTKLELGPHYATRSYIWGKVPKGVNLQLHDTVHHAPVLFREL